MRVVHRALGPRLPYLVLVLLALVAAGAGASGLLLDPDRTRLGANETLSLRLIADGRLKGEPDLSPLEKDFEVLSRSTSTRTTIVNGDMSKSREWALELAPRRTGELQIPPIALGGERSQPVTIQVVPAAQASPDAGPRPLFLDTQVDNPSPYVQEPILYRVKVYYREAPWQASLSEPQAEGATLERRGEDQSSTELVDGQRYTVVERHYLVVPQRSGPLSIVSPRLDAVVADARRPARRSPFADLDELLGGRVLQGFPAMPEPGAGRRVVERGPDRALEVRPQPEGAATPWLPARSIQLSDQWGQSSKAPRVGEPITRTLTITAEGTTAAQLPILDPGAPEGVKVYPEPPSFEDLAGTGPPAAIKTLKLALVPTRPGPLTLPEVRLHWWDTVADRQRVAVIPERTLQVEPAEGAAPGPGSIPGQTQMEPPGWSGIPASGGSEVDPGEGNLDPKAGSQPPRVPQYPGAMAGPWPWLSLLLGLGWLLTLGGMLWRRRRPGPPVVAGKRPGGRPQSVDEARDRLRRACARGDPRGARDALLAWGRARWPEQPPVGLGSLSGRLGGKDAGLVLGAIDRAIYAQDAASGEGAWDGTAAWRRIEPLLSAEPSVGRAPGPAPLPPLYPQGP